MYRYTYNYDTLIKIIPNLGRARDTVLGVIW